MWGVPFHPDEGRTGVTSCTGSTSALNVYPEPFAAAGVKTKGFKWSVEPAGIEAVGSAGTPPQYGAATLEQGGTSCVLVGFYFSAPPCLREPWAARFSDPRR